MRKSDGAISAADFLGVPKQFPIVVLEIKKQSTGLWKEELEKNTREKTNFLGIFLKIIDLR